MFGPFAGPDAGSVVGPLAGLWLVGWAASGEAPLGGEPEDPPPLGWPEDPPAPPVPERSLSLLAPLTSGPPPPLPVPLPARLDLGVASPVMPGGVVGPPKPVFSFTGSRSKRPTVNSAPLYLSLAAQGGSMLTTESPASPGLPTPRRLPSAKNTVSETMPIMAGPLYRVGVGGGGGAFGFGG